MPTSAPDRDLRVEGLTVTYRGLPAVAGVNIEVPAGKVVAVLGSNGAGKTTLLQAISGAVRPASGRVLLGNERIDGEPAYAVARRGVYHLPEARGLFSELTVKENFALASSVIGRAAVAARLPQILEAFPMLAGRLDTPAATLSGGQQQMLAIARALLVRPRLLLVDELSFGLAPLVAKQAFEMLALLNREVGSSVILVEQNVGWALRVSSYAYVLKTGSIAMQGEPSALLSDRHLLFTYLGAEASPTN